MSFFSLAIKFIIDFIIGNILAYFTLIIGFIFLLLSTSYNIYYNLKPHKTYGIKTTLCHYRGHNYKKTLRFEDFKEIYQDNNDFKQLCNIHLYQKNYFDLLNKTRKITKISLLGFILSLIISSIILLISLVISEL